MQQAQFGMIGLGTMGRNLVLNIADHGIPVCGYDRNPDQQRRLTEEGKDKPVQVAASMQDFVNSLSAPRRIMMLVPAGKIVDAVIDEIAPLLQPGDILIDGGNSHYTDTDIRIERLMDTGIHFTGMGVSGGEDGARSGPSMMPGGNIAGYAELQPILEKIAAQTADGPCVTFIGNGSAGHYTKMVHNGIEYAIMQLISEVYGVLKNVAGLNNDELHELFSKWDNGKLQSFLIEITAKVFVQPDDKDATKQLVDVILDRAGQKGTGMWTSNSALELHVPTPTINDAVTARDISVYKTERVQIEGYRTSAALTAAADKNVLIQQLHDALYFGIVSSYVQGMHLLRKASDTYNYQIDIAEVVRIWKGGCIIRSVILNDIRSVYVNNKELTNLLLDKNFYQQLIANRPALVEVLKTAMENNIGTPCLASSLNYVDMMGTGRLASNLIQAQRDLFGAHTYERIDAAGAFHTNWN
jgi:6-phosphogluconate dehydrogenase